jgi:hypothetical protein
MLRAGRAGSPKAALRGGTIRPQAGLPSVSEAHRAERGHVVPSLHWDIP